MDSFLDQPFIDLETEFNEIDKGIKPLEESKLFKFLVPDMQTLVLEMPHELETLYSFRFQHIPFVENIPISIHDMLRQFTNTQQLFNRRINALNRKLQFTAEYCTLKNPIERMCVLAVYLTLTRFCVEFGLPKFLNCFVSCNDSQVTNSHPLFRQMAASRLNFIFHGKYLPIVAYFAGDRHATSMLVIPVLSDENNMLNWKFIHINSNGDEYDDRFRHVPEDAMREYIAFVKSQKQNITFHSSSRCVADIQKNFETCVSWSILLAFQFLIDFDQKRFLHTHGDVDIIDMFCQQLAMRTSNKLVMQRLNTYFLDFILAFQRLSLDAYIKSANPEQKMTGPPRVPNGPPTFLHGGLPLIPTIQQYIHELLHGEERPIQHLSLKIFQTMSRIHTYLRKDTTHGQRKTFLNKSFALRNETETENTSNDASYETEDETEHEKEVVKRRQDELQSIKVKKEKCSELQRNLVELKSKFENAVLSSKDTSSLREQIKSISQQLLDTLDDIPELYGNRKKWFNQWFRREIKIKIKKLENEIVSDDAEFQECESQLAMKSESSGSEEMSSSSEDEISELTDKMEKLEEKLSDNQAELKSLLKAVDVEKVHISQAREFLKFINQMSKRKREDDDDD